MGDGLPGVELRRRRGLAGGNVWNRLPSAAEGSVQRWPPRCAFLLPRRHSSATAKCSLARRRTMLPFVERQLRVLSLGTAPRPRGGRLDCGVRDLAHCPEQGSVVDRLVQQDDWAVAAATLTQLRRSARWR
jgi:hypothetical protein